MSPQLKLPKTIQESILFYRDAKSVDCSEETLKAIERWLCLNDLFYLLVYACGRKDMIHPWLFDRCREVQASPDGHLDLWARNHYKSTIITFGKTIQDILEDPETTINIFSHVRPISKSFLNQIKRELQSNEKLKYLFDDVLWADPEKEAPSWSLDSGLIVRRKSNPKEPTINASGLVDGQPTGMHFKRRIYDDVIVPASVASPEQMAKTLEALDLSDNLGTKGGIVRMIGTRYKLGDAYEDYIKRGIVNPRIYPATDNGRADGIPVFLTESEWENKLQNQSPAIIASQMLQNPLASNSVIYQPEWFRLWPAYMRDADGRIKKDKNGLDIRIELPEFEMVFLSLDGAFSDKTTADDSCLIALGLWKPIEGSPKYAVMLLDCYMEQVDYPTLKDEVIRQYGNKFGKTDKQVDGIIVENKASGSALIPELRKANITVYSYNPGSLDKTARANLVSPLVRDGYLYIPESANVKRQGYPMSWLGKWHEQMLYFPNVAHDDAVDATVQALSVLDRMGYLRGKSAPVREQPYYVKSDVGSYG